MKARILSKEERLQISREYVGGSTAPQLSEKYKCSLNQVYDIAKKFGGKYKLNQEIEITEKQHQILLGGILGDGYFKRNGVHNVRYSECHALGEVDYLKWKHSQLGNLTKESKIYGKNLNNGYADAKEFTTKTTPSLNGYLDYTRETVINELEELGLIIHLLDDGWLTKYIPREGSTNPSTGRYSITTYTWTDKEMNLLIKRWKDVADINFKATGVKRVNLTAKSEESDKIYDLTRRYLPMDLDICKKKFSIFLS